MSIYYMSVSILILRRKAPLVRPEALGGSRGAGGGGKRQHAPHSSSMHEHCYEQVCVKTSTYDHICAYMDMYEQK